MLTFVSTALGEEEHCIVLFMIFCLVANNLRYKLYNNEFHNEFICQFMGNGRVTCGKKQIGNLNEYHTLYNEMDKKYNGPHRAQAKKCAGMVD